MDSTEAIYEASLLRFRPIMMTTMAALLGGIPLAVGTGLGSELRRPLGIAMVGGLLLSQILTLYTTPVIYIFFDRLGQRVTGRRVSRKTQRDSERSPARRAHEPLGSIHPAAGGHHAAHHCGGHCRRRSPSWCCRWRRCRRWTFPPSASSAGLPGASAQIMAASVATPLERQFSHIAGITEMTSSSSLGQTNVTLQFDLSRNIDGAARDVQAAINAARTYLPANLPSNPSYRKVNPADSPIMILSLTSDKYDVTKIYDLASTILEQKLRRFRVWARWLCKAAPRPRCASKSTPPSWKALASRWAACNRCSACRTRTSPAASSPTTASAKTSSPTIRSPRRPTTGR